MAWLPPTRDESGAPANGETIDDTREVNPGEVWEENEFWLELTWRIDPDGSLGIRQYAESKKNPGTRLVSTSTTNGSSTTRFPVCRKVRRRKI